MLAPAQNDIVDNYFERLLRSLITHLSGRENDIVSRALLFFLVRVTNTWTSLRTLGSHSPDQEIFMVDACVLLRCMFDAYLQAEYVLVEPAKREERARLYFDFKHIDRHKGQEKILKLPGWFGERMRSSPMRPEGEKYNQQEYERVRSLFPKQNGKGIRDKWYEGNLFDLAVDAKKDAEYDLFVHPSHGCVHSSAFAVSRPMMAPQLLMVLATALAARVARLNIRYSQVTLGADDMKILDTACQDFFEAS